MRVHDPELDPVVLAVEPHQVRSNRRAAVEAELADALRDLSDEQIVAVELARGQREVDAVPLEIDGEEPGPDLAPPRHFAERAARRVGALRARRAAQSGDEGEEQGGRAGKGHAGAPDDW